MTENGKVYPKHNIEEVSLAGVNAVMMRYYEKWPSKNNPSEFHERYDIRYVTTGKITNLGFSLNSLEQFESFVAHATSLLERVKQSNGGVKQ